MSHHYCQTPIQKKVSHFPTVIHGKNVEEVSSDRSDSLSSWTTLTLRDRAGPCSRDYVVKVNFLLLWHKIVWTKKTSFIPVFWCTLTSFQTQLGPQSLFFPDCVCLAMTCNWLMYSSAWLASLQSPQCSFVAGCLCCLCKNKCKTKWQIPDA